MSIGHKQVSSFIERGFTRRQVGRIATVLSAGASLPFYNEFAMAQQAEQRMQRPRGAMPAGAVRISSNENPLGPCKEGLEAIYKVAQYGGRYQPFGESDAFVKTVAEVEGVKPEYVAAFAGSSDPLHRTICAFASPSRSMVMANPGYGGGTATFIGAQLHRVPLRADFTHDVEAMIKADPNAGLYYVCNPNNPSGTVTPRKDIEYLLANKKKDAIVLVDEAYIHFSDSAQVCSDLVSADKDVVVLRTFSKAYGMAGLRAGFALARPDLLAKMRPYGSGMLPITGMACATASLRVKDLMAERLSINKRVREDTLEFLEKKKVKYVPSETSFFMMEVHRPGMEFAKAMAEQNIYIGRVWPVWPTKVRVSIGTQEEMNKFKAAFDKAWES
ncbi:MAG: pyridoxal phosphate-dependent aminotransferase [Bryobacterales bacterium]|nr:pyridoxal phosphate-dependent aminotransferase [Bryobacterales bacterium]